MDNHSEVLDKAANDILSSKRVLMRAPAAHLLTPFYASPETITTRIAEATSSRGRYRQSSNSKSFSGGANFSLSGSSIQRNFALHASVTVLANTNLRAGWLLSAIKDSQITFSNSLMQNINLSGLSMAQVLLLLCKNPEEREKLLLQAGRPNNGVAGTYFGSIPIGNLVLAAGSASGMPIDASTLNGPMNILVNFNRYTAFISKITNGAVAMPTAFQTLELSLESTDLLSSAFSIRNALSYGAGPDGSQLSYNIPTTYWNSVRLNIPAFPVTGGVEKHLQLSSIPAGMLKVIVLTIKPALQYEGANNEADGNADKYNGVFGSVNLSSLKVTFGGTTLYQANSASEIESNTRACFDGDDLSYQFNDAKYAAASASIAEQSRYSGRVIAIPLCYDGCEAIRGMHLENLPSYSGSNLELSFSVEEVGRTHRVAATPFLETLVPLTAVEVANTPVDWIVEACYGLSAIMEISNGAIDLQL